MCKRVVDPRVVNNPHLYDIVYLRSGLYELFIDIFSKDLIQISKSDHSSYIIIQFFLFSDEVLRMYTQ